MKPEPISDTDKILEQPHGDIHPLVKDGHDANDAVGEFAEEEVMPVVSCKKSLCLQIGRNKIAR